MVLLHTAQTDIAAACRAELGRLSQSRLFVSAEEDGDDGDGEEEAHDGYHNANYRAGTEAVASGAGVGDGDYGWWGFRGEGGGGEGGWCHCVCLIVIVVKGRLVLQVKMIEDAKALCL